MNMTIIYATYSQSTAIASQFLLEQLQSPERVVTLVEARQATAEAMKAADVLILASPSWDYAGQQGVPHEDYSSLKSLVGDLDLEKKPFAVMGLGDSTFTYYCGAVGHLTEWLKSWHGTELVPPLKIDQYYAHEPEAQKEITAWAQGILAKLSPAAN